MDKRVIEYHVVIGQQTDIFQAKVNELIRQGWQPQGGVSWYHDSGTKQGIMSQAMVIYAE